MFELGWWVEDGEVGEERDVERGGRGFGLVGEGVNVLVEWVKRVWGGLYVVFECGLEGFEVGFVKVGLGGDCLWLLG